MFAAVGLFLLCAPVKADECISVDSFASELSKKGITLIGSKSAATVKLAKTFNENRATNGQPPAEISIFLLGLVVSPDGTPQILAAIADKQGCIIPKSVVVMPVRYLVGLLERAGVSIDEFIPLDGA